MKTVTWLSPQDAPEWFPPLEQALDEPPGLLAAGGDLSPPRLLAAYQRGIFPWYSPGQPVLWWSPDPRAVLFPEEFNCSRSLAKTIRNGGFEVVVDRDFAAVIDACAAPRPHAPGTWITSEMRNAYLRLHRLGQAHSVEAWRAGKLAGGLYGVRLGEVFFWRIDVQPRAGRLEGRPRPPGRGVSAQQHRGHRLPAAFTPSRQPRFPNHPEAAIPGFIARTHLAGPGSAARSLAALRNPSSALLLP